MRRAFVDKEMSKEQQTWVYYHTCLERVNSMILEKNSEISRSRENILKLLQTINYFRPKELQKSENMRLKHGLFHKSELQDDVISVKHKELIKEKGQQNRMVPTDMTNFLF